MEAEVNFAQLFRNRAATYGDRVRWRQKRSGHWQSMTWRENQALVNRLISGLDALGAAPGDVIAILSETRWEWMAADWAILGLGGVTVTIYPTNVPATTAFILNDSGARFIFAQNRMQFEKLVSIRDEVPQVRRVILFEDAEQVEDDPWTVSFDDLAALSLRSPTEADAFAATRAQVIAPSDRMTLVYTSGTTGMPKGVVHTHATFLAQLAGVRAKLGQDVRPGMVDLLFLPLAHVFGREEHLSSYDQGLHTVVAQSNETLAEELREVKPDLLFSVPRIYEKAYAAIRARVEAGPRSRRRIFAWAERVGRRVSRRRAAGKHVPPLLALRYRLADRLVFHKIREALGGKLLFAVTAAAPLDPEIQEFFNAAGVLLLDGWGLTETSGGFTLNTVRQHRLGTVGTPFPGHELRLAEDGEILVRGPCVFPGYHNNPAATVEAFVDGWFCTGDIGEVDEAGFVRIVDRKKDLIITAGGKNIAPQQVENTLKTIPLVSQVAVYGDRKPYLVALLTLDATVAQAWARERGLSASSMAELAEAPELRAYLKERVAQANTQLASYETVKRYDVLPEDFTAENDLLTPTLKIRRRAIHARYRDRFEALYLAER